MYPSGFEYTRPATLDEAIAALSEAGADGKVLAGGCSLIPLMKQRLAEPALIVDIGRIPGVAAIDVPDTGAITIGALVRQRDILGSAALVRHVPILADATAVIADPIVRNMGTLGGNLAHGDPANDDPAVMTVLDAEVLARGPAGERSIPIRAFYPGILETALLPGEIVTSVRIPRLLPGSSCGYHKVERQVGDFAMAAAAAWVRVEGDRIADARLAFTNLGGVAVTVPEADERLRGSTTETASLEAASRVAADALEPWDDIRASAPMKRRMAAVAAARALRLAVDRATQGGA